MNRRAHEAPSSGAMPVDYRQPSPAELSEQIGALSQQVTQVLAATYNNSEQVWGLGQRVNGLQAHLQDHSEAVRGRLDVLQSDVQLLRATQVKDHAPRILEVEKKAARRSLAPIARATGKYGAVAIAIPALLQLAAAIKPSLAGPLEQIIQFFQ